MFKSVEELKSFISWAKQQGVKQLKVGDIEAQFSELAFLPESSLSEIGSGGASTLAETEQLDPREEEELLYHSSNL